MNIERKIKFQAVTYDDVKNGIEFKNDNFRLAAYLTETRKRTFFANPNLTDYSECLMSLEYVDDVIAGRSMLYPTKVKIGDSVFQCQSSSTLDVPVEFRSLGLGANLFYYLTRLTPYDYVICSGISDLALPLYKAMKYYILEFPRMMLLCNSRSILESYGFKGKSLRVLTNIVNLLLKCRKKALKRKAKSLNERFNVKRETIIPDWVELIVLNDGHQYCEYHDLKWLQWNLDYNFKGDKKDIQSFFSIYEGDNPIGFFMTKERYRKEAGGKLKNIILGAIVEWGSADFSKLSESDIIKIAINTFSPEVDIVEFATSDDVTVKAMQKCGFIKHGCAHIAFKDKTKKCANASEINNWRVRYGYADVILT